MRKIFYGLVIVFGILLASFGIQESYGQTESIPDPPPKYQLSPFTDELIFIMIFVSPFIYFVTWNIIKKVLHKKYPKIIGLIALITFVLIVFFYMNWGFILYYWGL